MTYQLFSKGIKKYQDFNEILDKLNNLGFHLVESNLIEDAYSIFDIWIESILNEEGQDLIYWWLFEDVEKIIYEDGKSNINVEKLEDLYTYMHSLNMFKL